MNILKIIAVVLLVGAVFSACDMNAEVCYECTATDPNGQGTPVSSEICDDELSEQEQSSFQTNFEAQHDPTMYDISCGVK